jgi:thiamine biosynthesis lipoprotein
MATALIVMGAPRGLAYAQAHGVAAYFIVREGGALVPHATPAFARLGGTRVA